MNNQINIITLCSGYDSQCLALKRLGVNFNLVAWSEFDPESNKPLEQQPAVIAHNVLFPEFRDRNVGDMTKVDWTKFSDTEIDILTYSTPCQSYSLAGTQDGGSENSGTKSSILWFTENAIETLKPKYLIQENVKNLVSEKFISEFNKWCQRVEQHGYRNYWTVLNAKDFGIPQSRERLFMVSIRDDIEREFKFPGNVKLTKNLNDYLDKDVDSKFFYSKERVDNYISKIKQENKTVYKSEPLF